MDRAFPDEIFGEISSHILDGATWKAWIFTCKMFAKMNNPGQINRFSNHLLTLLTMLPDKPWNWHEISRNVNITPQIIEAYPEFPWAWKYVAYNMNLTLDFIERNIDKFPKRNCWFTKCSEQDPVKKTIVGIDFIRKHKELYHNDDTGDVGHTISTMIPWNVIRANPDLPWDKSVFQNPTVTYDNLREVYEMFPCTNCRNHYACTSWLSSNPSLSWITVVSEVKCPYWDWDMISRLGTRQPWM